jgi:oxygen-independent coproporphyrinogen-3 oxidase
MAGIYIHIPYCRQACRYCDFHFEVSTWNKKELIPFLLREIEERSDYLGNENLNTIYFGGGSPSVLEKTELESIIEKIYKFYKIDRDAEISLEANPDDLSKKYLDDLMDIGINRLSIGVQSFNDADLEIMHRIHNSEKAFQSIKEAKNSGFENISIDLIYGLPGQATGVWEKNLEFAFLLGIQHLSAYHLTYEQGTIFEHWRKKGRIIPVQEEESLKQFKTLVKTALQNGFEHYEISNFALPGFKSRHNSSYWEGKKYLGIGPSAHSFDQGSRRWNISSNKKYMASILSGEAYFEEEALSLLDKYNEFVMISFRTAKGVDSDYLREIFGEEKLKYFIKKIGKFVQSGHVNNNKAIYTLSEEGIFISDHVISGLFLSDFRRSKK